MRKLHILLLVLIFCSALGSDYKLLGTSKFSWLIFDIYDAKLWGQDSKLGLNQQLTLELTYLRDLNGRKIGEQSIKEMRSQDIDDKLLKSWSPYILELFPNVKRGDKIKAIYNPKKGIQFIFNDEKMLGNKDDIIFAKSFIGIWLSPKTSRSKTRKELFGIVND